MTITHDRLEVPVIPLLLVLHLVSVVAGVAFFRHVRGQEAATYSLWATQRDSNTQVYKGIDEVLGLTSKLADAVRRLDQLTGQLQNVVARGGFVNVDGAEMEAQVVELWARLDRLGNGVLDSYGALSARVAALERYLGPATASADTTPPAAVQMATPPSAARASRSA